ncbi:MAG: Perchlorate reductase subunit alpha [Turneriella sp.]|nr:Perchlorate reductase subunit alpha [Turneriella sp.]
MPLENKPKKELSPIDREMSRSDFVKGTAALTATLLLAYCKKTPLRYFEPLHIENPLKGYPNRNWEEVYRNIFKEDSTFVFLCAPNDTHNCLLKAYVKNDVITRIGPTFGYGKATDLYGNKASHRWDPRICQKGLALVRRIYGDRRIKGAMIRKGFKDWVDAGFPRDATTGKPDAKYFQRGKDKWQRIEWKDAYAISAKALHNISKEYTGEQGSKKLLAQGYDADMVKATHGAGTQVIKVRGGMAFLGSTRIFGLYRFANMLALLDAKLRGVGADKALGARGWDSFSWHTDLPPGHPMVTGMQASDFELSAVEYSKLAIVWGMNWITTKMPDSHWLTEARLKGTKTVTVTVEYSATASKTDDVIVIRPGTDPAFALGLAQVIIAKEKYDKTFVENNTDLPFLVRLDTLDFLRPEDCIDDYKVVPPRNLGTFKAGEKPPKIYEQKQQYAPENLLSDFQAFVVVDQKSGKLVAVTRDDWGPGFAKKKIHPELNIDQTVALKNGKKVKVRSVFDLMKQYLDANFTPAKTAQVTGTTAQAIQKLALEIAANPETTLILTGMGPNQFFNADLKDRAIFLVAALTRNVGFPGGNVGSFSGNYRSSLIGGEPVYATEDPFNVQTRAGGKLKVKKYLKYESLHYFNYGDRPLRAGNKQFTPENHMPTPTKAMWLNNSNSVIGNAKWHYDVVNNTLPKLEFIAYSDWWWTGSCEYSDIVYGVDSWAEFKVPDMCASYTNPFVQIYPETPIDRIFDTKSDIEVIAQISKALGKLIDDDRMTDMWKFALNGDVGVYLQRIIDNSPTLREYDFGELHTNAKKGIPTLMNNRTYPRISSYEQAKGEIPWYTKSGRLEFYRPEKEFQESGENIIVYREPIDSTPHEPNVIVATRHPAIRPLSPDDYGFSKNDLSTESRQVRNVIVTVKELLDSSHPLKGRGFTHVYHTPKYRHGAHSTPVDTDYTSVWFGPFGDIYRHDARMPSVVEGYVDINPLDAKALGVEDGDYVYIDADPEDRPYRGYKKGSEEFEVARLLLRARYYPGTPRGIARTWHNMYGATIGSVRGQKASKIGLAKNPDTNYQSMYRYGSHQSATRAWMRPTLMTDSLVHKEMFGQSLEKGFAPDIHCPNGAPREAFVKITKAEHGGLQGKIWRPAALGFRPTYENPAMRRYLVGGFLKVV